MNYWIVKANYSLELLRNFTGVEGEKLAIWEASWEIPCGRGDLKKGVGQKKEFRRERRLKSSLLAGSSYF